MRIISVVETPHLPVTFPGERMNMPLDAELRTLAHNRASAAVDTAAATLRTDEGSRQLSVTTAVLAGSPKGLILEEADAFVADLIVVGSHGHGMVERFLLGSVSQAVALHARCSVEIVRSLKPPRAKAVGRK